MTAPAVIKAAWADFRIIKGRKVASLSFEVPLETADEALAVLGGVPRPDQSQWVAIARLTEPAASAPPQPTEPKERKPFNTLPYSQQAAMRCHEPAFWRYLSERWDYDVCRMEDAAAAVRDICGVDSRSKIAAGTKAGAEWERLNDAFGAWMRCEV